MSVRSKAWEILCGIFFDENYSNLSLRELKNEFSSQDQALLTRLVYGTLQNNRYLRYQWRSYATSKPDGKIAILLDMACYELLMMHSAEYAVVNEATEIAKGYKKGYLTNFVNAILRKVTRNGAIEITVDDQVEKEAIEHSVPTWIYRMWISHYDCETALKIAESTHTEAKNFLRVNTLKISKKELLSQDENFIDLRDDAVQYNGNFIRTKWFEEGYIVAQDLHSQDVSVFADLKKDTRVLDLCAAPGSKSFHASALMENSGEIIAVDLYKSRTKLIQEGARKLGIKNIKTLAIDGRKVNMYLDEKSFDTVMVDAPCSGLGVLRHKPDIKCHLKPEDLDNINKLQIDLLESGAKMVKDKGILVYSTCTLNKKENGKRADDFSKSHPMFKEIERKTVFPFEDEADGFFMVKWQRDDEYERTDL